MTSVSAPLCPFARADDELSRAHRSHAADRRNRDADKQARAKGKNAGASESQKRPAAHTLIYKTTSHERETLLRKMHGRDWRDSTDDQIDAALEQMESDDRHNISWM